MVQPFIPTRPVVVLVVLVVSVDINVKHGTDLE
jgi:hypothetical protein